MKCLRKIRKRMGLGGGGCYGGGGGGSGKRDKGSTRKRRNQIAYTEESLMLERESKRVSRVEPAVLASADPDPDGAVPDPDPDGAVPVPQDEHMKNLKGNDLDTSGLLDNKLAKVYEMYQEACDDLCHERSQRRHAEAVLQRVMLEIAERSKAILDGPEGQTPDPSITDTPPQGFCGGQYRPRQHEVDSFSVEADRASITTKQTCVLLEQRFSTLSAENNCYKARLAELAATFEQCAADLASSQAETKELRMQATAKDGEIERLNVEILKLHKYKRTQNVEPNLTPNITNTQGQERIYTPYESAPAMRKKKEVDTQRRGDTKGSC